MNYCPDWIFDAVSAQAAKEFLVQEVPLRLIANKYAEGLSKKYSAIAVEEIEECAESMIRALDEVKVESEAVVILNDYCFFRLKFESHNIKRKMKPLFGSVDAPFSEKMFGVDVATKRFKAYLFSLRSGVTVQVTPGWKLSNFDELPFLKEIAAKTVNVLDIL